MSKIDDLVTFTGATLDDVDEIMGFIKKYWNENHILANDKEFFLYEFKNGDKLNYFLARSKEDGKILASLAMYPTCLEPDTPVMDMSSGMFKVADDCKIPMIGTEMLRRSRDYYNVRNYTGNGANPKTALIVAERALKEKCGKLKHYYMLADIDEYHIATINEKRILKIEADEQKVLYKIQTIEEFTERIDEQEYLNRVPYKDLKYIKKRYFDHPIYDYVMYGIEGKAVLVTREVHEGDRKILRIVDILGNPEMIRFVGKSLRKLSDSNSYEYIDIYEYGIADDAMSKAGFVMLKDDDKNIIPNYFEPFVRSNVDIYFHCNYDNPYVFKADGDQDRPNRRRKEA